MTSNKYLSTLLLFLLGLGTAWGQGAQAAAAADTQIFATTMTDAFLIALAGLFVVSLLVLIKANAFLTKRLMRLEAEKNGVVFAEESAEPQPIEEDFFTRLRKKYWENPIPMEKEGEITLNHNYDGIRELDNHLPPWWVNMFILTVIWAIGYMWWYHWGGNGLNQADEYKQEVATAKKEIAMALAGKANAVDESNVFALNDSGALGEGELIFKNSCAACHGTQGEGTVGPNLTDENWLHGGGIKNVFKVIKYGVPEKGMIAWASQLKPADMQKVASYILTLKGTNPPNPKAPQGEIWTEAMAAQDTTATQ